LIIDLRRRTCKSVNLIIIGYFAKILGMKEVDERISDLYGQLRGTEGNSQDSPFLTDGVSRLRRPQVASRNREQSKLHREILSLIRERPGVYALSELSYGPKGSISGEPGFRFGFDYAIENELFDLVDYWAYNRWGIYVEKHPEGYSPEIEVFDSAERFGNRDGQLTCLHLPDGIRIPVGPIQAGLQRVPNKITAGDQTQSEDLGIETVAKDSGVVWVGGRYFYWQPVLPETPARIAIDFSKINPLQASLTLKDAPIFTDTVVDPEY
jgi:hypothetical protein